MPSNKKSKVDSKAITIFDPNKPITIYELLRPDKGNRPVYVGRTCALGRRSGQHKTSTCPLVKLLRELTDISIRDNIRPVPELPFGVPASRAVEFEAFFIMQRRTLYHAIDNELGCNTNNGAHLDQLTPARYREIEAELAAGYEWPVNAGLKSDVPAEVAMARNKETVVEEIVAKVAATGGSPALVNKLRRDMALVIADREAAEKTHLTSRKMVEELAEKYKHAQLDAIDREQFAKELNRVKDKINMDGTDEVINGIVNSVLLAAKVQRVVTMSSNAAAMFVSGIADMLATREEDRLVWTNETVKKRMYVVRAWSRRNGGLKRPVKTKDASEERSLAQFLNQWKKPTAKDYGGECTDLQQSIVLMRDFPWFNKDVVGRKDSLESVTAEANKQLKEGFAHKDEPNFFGTKPLKSGANASDQKRVYTKIDNMVLGAGKLADVETMIEGLPETRADWYRKQWQSKEKEYKAGRVAKNAAVKKRKREDEEATGGGPSSSVPDDAGPSLSAADDDDDDDDDDEDE